MHGMFTYEGILNFVIIRKISIKTVKRCGSFFKSSASSILKSQGKRIPSSDPLAIEPCLKIQICRPGFNPPYQHQEESHTCHLPSYPTPRLLLKRNRHICLYRNLHISVYGFFICKSHKLELPCYSSADDG